MKKTMIVVTLMLVMMVMSHTAFATVNEEACKKMFDIYTMECRGQNPYTVGTQFAGKRACSADDFSNADQGNYSYYNTGINKKAFDDYCRMACGKSSELVRYDDFKDTICEKGKVKDKVKSEIKNQYGTLRVMQTNTDGEYLEINGKKVKAIKNDIVGIEKEFKLNNSQLVLVTSNCSGSSCTSTNYYLVTLQSKNAYSISKPFSFSDPADWNKKAYKVQQQGNKIVMQFDRIYRDVTKTYYDGAMTVTYENGKVKLVTEKSKRN